MLKIWVKATVLGTPNDQLCQVLDLIARNEQAALDEIHVLMCGTGERRIIDSSDICGLCIDDSSNGRSLSLYFRQMMCPDREAQPAPSPYDASVKRLLTRSRGIARVGRIQP